MRISASLPEPLRAGGLQTYLIGSQPRLRQPLVHLGLLQFVGELS